ncbi:MAG: CobW family GTP-binding protein [Eubacteriales bacterium]
MNIILLGGFLGSGKTSVLISMAHYLTKANFKNQEIRLAIIENEIGEISVDNKILQGGGYNVSTLFSGCICCTLAGDLTIALNDIAVKYAPEYTIIEATGLAYPSRIVDTIREYGKNVKAIQIIAIVDAERWQENYDALEVLMCGQLQCADIILLNKIDVMADSFVIQITKELQEINNDAKIYPVSAKNGIEYNVWSSILGKEE